MSTKRSLRLTVGAIAVLGAAALALSGCSTSSSSGGDKSGDLTLKLGTILPQTGTLATLGPPAIEASNLAVADINKANKGIKIDITQKDSGDTSTNIATQSVTSLLAAGNTAILGAESSSVTLTVLKQVTSAKTLLFSPANTSPDLSSDDDNGYFWRDAPSDVLQGKVLGEKVAKDGHTNVSILYQNDSYGSGLAKNVKASLEAQGVTVASYTAFDPNASDFSSEVNTVLAPNPDALVAITFDQIKKIAPLLETAGFDFKNFYGSDGNFGVIDPTYKDVSIEGAQFTNPGNQATDDFKKRLQAQAKKDGAKELQAWSYAPETYDGVVVMALAALKGGATDGTTLKDNLQSITSGDTDCKTFSACADLIKDGKSIHYQGLSGPISFQDNGDPGQAYISIYKYNKDNSNTFESAEFGDLTKN
ncbi:ABC transporter substrate-binding protein [Gryllotalpicola ginsengisoli]|uniref:ABC transporter substrate-binding protein n=1 Tax=Gryllotalpicola ginsengisoli TaxID=444608 RepID=UPI0003B71017|nr:ABC transporter substrate-binding protein [Gryllotalpicola ginsengisoli]